MVPIVSLECCTTSLVTNHRAESVDGKTAMTFANVFAIRRALENAGVELIDENGGGPGARLKQRLCACKSIWRTVVIVVISSTRISSLLAEGEASMMAANDLAVRRALEMAGVDFIDENGG